MTKKHALKSVFATAALVAIFCVSAFADGNEKKDEPASPTRTAWLEGLIQPYDVVLIPGGRDVIKDPTTGKDALYYPHPPKVYVTAKALKDNPSTRGVVVLWDITNAPKTLTTALKTPRGISTDGMYLYVADEASGGVYRVSFAGETALVAGGIKNPRYVTMDDKGNLYVSARKGGGEKDEEKEEEGEHEEKDGVVYRILRGAGLPWKVEIAAEGFENPRGVSWWEGVLYAADDAKIKEGEKEYEGLLYKVDAKGAKTLYAKGFPGVEGIDLDACGNVYVAHEKEEEGEMEKEEEGDVQNEGVVEVVFQDGYRSVQMEGLGQAMGLSVMPSVASSLPDPPLAIVDRQRGVERVDGGQVEIAGETGITSLVYGQRYAPGAYSRNGGGDFFWAGVDNLTEQDRYVIFQSFSSQGPWEKVEEFPAVRMRLSPEQEPYLDENNRYTFILEDDRVDVYFRVEARNKDGKLIKFYPTLCFPRPARCEEGKPLPFLQGKGTNEASPAPLLQSLERNLTNNPNPTSVPVGTDLGVSWPCLQLEWCVPEYDREWLNDFQLTAVIGTGGGKAGGGN